jgi:ribosome maturation factor RimP
MAQPTIQHELEAELASVAENAGCELVHAEFQGGVLRVLLDRPEGITVNDCASVSRQLSPILDVHDFANQRYVLEVSSPGLDRPLHRPKDYQRFVGYRIRMTFFYGSPRAKATQVGRLDAFDPEDGGTVTFREEPSQTIHTLSLDDIKMARLEIDQDLESPQGSTGSQA